MNAKQANQISIRNYLSSIGINPVRSNKSSSLYLAPYRTETIPSLKVSHDQNLWVDYGNDNKGGTLIDLVLQIHPSFTVSDAIRAIEKTTHSFFSFHQQNSHLIENMKKEIPNAKQETGKVRLKKGDRKHEIQNMKHETASDSIIRIDKVREMGNNQVLVSYLSSRGIQITTARPFCKEVYYNTKDKRYFGIGNQNDRGWSIRNKYWKGCTAQGYSYYKRGFKRLSVFEGIFDLLSFIELNKGKQIEADFLVLNSLVNLKKAILILQKYKVVKLYLDHDMAGRKATQHIIHQFPNAIDASSFYSSFKDLNEYHVLATKKQLVINNQ